MKDTSSIDVIGPWTEIKLDIVKMYAGAYSRILTAQRHPELYHVYIDGFCGGGLNISWASWEVVFGTAMNALNVTPPFREYYFIDLDNEKVSALKDLVGDRADVHVMGGDVNEILPTRVLPYVKYEDYRRALCVLDPYGLDLDWQVVQAIGRSKSVDLFLNFPAVGMNREALWRNPEAVPARQQAAMTRFWGDESWRSIAYTNTGSLFGWLTKEPTSVVAKAYGERLRRVAGFRRVADPLPIRYKGAILYYLFFASHKPVAEEIVRDIFRRHGQG